MKLKTFTASTMAQALVMVKRHMGSQAVILHTRTYKRGGLFGFGAQSVVEITASDQAPRGQRRPLGKRAVPGARFAPSGAKSSQPLEVDTSAAGDLIRRTYAVAQQQLSQRQPSQTASAVDAAASPQRPVVAIPARVTPPPPTPSPVSGAVTPAQPAGATPTPVGAQSDNQQLVDEMRAVKRMVKQMMQQRREKTGSTATTGTGSKPDLPDKLFDRYLALLEQQVTEELAEQVIQQVRDQLTPAQYEDEQAVHRAALEVIAKQIPTDQAAGQLQPVGDGRPLTIALVGPTGVGKTTTIAKLAATFKLKQKKNVGLITLDTYRIAAVDQLRTYANIIGIPLHVASNGDELRTAVDRCSDCDVVLIDTAGRSQRDDPKLDQLRSLIAVADPHEVHLVLSSTCAQSVLLDVVERFSAVRTDRIIFTKLDEAVSFGVLLNVARRVNKRLSYITTGQEVPHRIEPSCSTRLAQLVLGTGKPC